MRGLRSIGAVALLVATLVSASRGQGPGTWIRGAPLLSSRTEVTGAELGGRLYVIGGFGQGGDQVEVYDSRAARWERRAPVPVPLHHAAAVAVGGRLYVVGGYSGGQSAVLNTVFEYDPAANRSAHPGAAPPRARGPWRPASHRRAAYATGGVGKPPVTRTSSRSTTPAQVGAAGADAGASRPPRGGGCRREAPRRRGASRRSYARISTPISVYRPRDERLDRPSRPLPAAQSGIAAAVLGSRCSCSAARHHRTFGQVGLYDAATSRWSAP